MERDLIKRFIKQKINVNVTPEEIKSYAKAESIRVLYRNTPMTMDLRMDRVNVHVNDDGIIQMVNMG